MIRKEGNGPRPWKSRVREVDGREVKRSFRLKGQAEDYERDLADRKARIKAGLPAPAGPITLSALIDLFFANRATKKSTDWLRRMLAHSELKFGTMPVRTLRPEEIGAWLHELQLAPKSKHHILTALRQVLDAGIEWGYLERNPARARAVESPGTKRARPIAPFASWKEVCAVAEQASLDKRDRHKVSGPLIRFACVTGLRPGEWLALTPAHVDKKTRTLTVPGTKTSNAARTLPLSVLALAALDDIPWPINPDGKLFPINYHQWRRTVWKEALAKACVSYRTPYEMRHTFATLALEQRVPIESLTPLMGHASFETTRRFYAKFTRRRLDDDVALLDNLGREPEREEEAK